MAYLFFWYLLVTVLGWLTFPLTYRLFPALADRGFSLARTLGMLIWGYLFWIMASLGIVENDLGGLYLGILLLATLSIPSLLRQEFRSSLLQWIRSNRRVIITVEVLFFIAFVAWAFVRAGNPEIVGTEKPMELAFINAILRSPTFPPHDPWLSGYAISYYYFGYVMAAMLAKATGTLGSVAFNLMLSLVFALSALSIYGVLYNLLALGRKVNLSSESSHPSIGWPLLGPFFLLIVSNFEGFLEVLHRKGVFWIINSNGVGTSAFWKWLDLQDLRNPPALPLGWLPERYYWWWRASRVITEYNLAHQWNEIIDEFPFFSYLLGDLHPHVLAMPFVFLLLGLALNLFLGGLDGETNLGLYRLPVHLPGLFFGALVLGGMAFLNTWDILFGFALLVGTFALSRVLSYGWSWKRLEEVLGLGLPLVLLAILLYLPFYLGFSSQAGGILPNLENPTRGAQLWIMFGPLFLPIIAWLINLWHRARLPSNIKLGLVLTFMVVLFLWAFSWLLGLLVVYRMPDFAAGHLAGEGFATISQFFAAAGLRRLSYIGGLLTLFVLLALSLAFILKENKTVQGLKDYIGPDHVQVSNPRVEYFVLFLVFLGAFLVLVPEFVFLRDQFNNRMNTIFKFYYQAWMVFSIAAAFGVIHMLRNLAGIRKWLYHAGLALVLFMALVYPVLGLLTKTAEFKFPMFLQEMKAQGDSGGLSPLQIASQVWTLDGGNFLSQIYPDDMAAAAWLRTSDYGVIVEATKPDASYSDYGRFSTYSGLPTVLGWPMHEGQWRGSYTPQGTRQDDIRQLYETASWDEAKAILSEYGIRYVCVGTLEKSTYHLNENKFQLHLVNVFQQGQVTIYEMP